MRKALEMKAVSSRKKHGHEDTPRMIQQQLKGRELTDQASPWYRPRELSLWNHPSALPGGWPASRGLECKTIRRRTSGQIREVPKGSGREMGMRTAYVHCEWKEREAGLPSGAATKL